MLENLELDYIQHLERGYCENHPDVLSGTKTQVVDRAVKQLLTALQALPLQDLTNGVKVGNGQIKYEGGQWQYSNDAGSTWQAIGSGAGDHLLLANIGSHSHAAIDQHIAQADIHFTKAQIGHAEIADSGNYSHSSIDSHLNNTGLHITSHLNLSGIGTQSHAAIDDHIANTAIHGGGGGGGGATPLATRYTSAPTLTTAQYAENILVCDYDGSLDLPTPTTDGQSVRIIHTTSGDLSVYHHLTVGGVINSANDDWGGSMAVTGRGSLYLVYCAASACWISVQSQGTWTWSEAA